MSPNNNHTSNGASAYTIDQEAVLTELDPDLQSLILARREGRELPPHLIEELTEGNQVFTVVDVIAKLKQPGQKIPGLWVVQQMGPIVTGLVDIDRIADVRKEVVSLKAARAVRPALCNSVPDISATPAQLHSALGSNHKPVDGSDIIVGFVDYGCDFAHPHFRELDQDKHTRILFLWDQREGTTQQSPPDFGYGREFDANAINKALDDTKTEVEPDAPHKALGYPLSDKHGTPVMDVAVGNGGGVNPPGVAPRADIIFVETSLGDFEPAQSFGNSRHLVDAVQYIFNRAQKLNRAAVVNISLSSDAGPHDGSTLVEQAFDYMLETPGRAIVMAAGNSCESHKHLRRRIYPGRTRTLLWNIPANDGTPNKLDIWYDGRRELELTLRFRNSTGVGTPPPDVVIGPFPLGTTFTIRKLVGGENQVAGRVFHRNCDPGNHDNNIVVSFERLMESGTWEVELSPSPDDETTPFDVDAWIERDNSQSSTFPEQRPSDSLCTIGALACGFSTIVVSAHDTFEPHGILSSSGTGPSRDGKLKPDVSAPGMNLKAAQPLTNTVEKVEGTSISTPHVSGVIALLMQAAPSFLTIEQTRALLLDFTRDQSPPSKANAWDPRYGAGRIDAAASVGAAAALPPPVVVVLEHEVITAEITTLDVPVPSDTELPVTVLEAGIAMVGVTVEAPAAITTYASDYQRTLNDDFKQHTHQPRRT